MELSQLQFWECSFSCGAREAYVFTCVWFWVQVDASWRLSLINSDEDDINFSLPLQSQNSLLGEEDLTDFVESLLVNPDEYGSENDVFSHPSNYILQSSSHAYEEVINNLQLPYLVAPDSLNDYLREC